MWRERHPGRTSITRRALPRNIAPTETESVGRWIDQWRTGSHLLRKRLTLLLMLLGYAISAYMPRSVDTDDLSVPI